MNCRHIWLPTPDPNVICSKCGLPLYIYLEDLEFRIKELEKKPTGFEVYG